MPNKLKEMQHTLETASELIANYEIELQDMRNLLARVLDASSGRFDVLRVPYDNPPDTTYFYIDKDVKSSEIHDDPSRVMSVRWNPIPTGITTRMMTIRKLRTELGL